MRQDLLQKHKIPLQINFLEKRWTSHWYHKIYSPDTLSTDKSRTIKKKMRSEVP